MEKMNNLGIVEDTPEYIQIINRQFCVKTTMTAN